MNLFVNQVQPAFPAVGVAWITLFLSSHTRGNEKYQRWVFSHLGYIEWMRTEPVGWSTYHLACQNFLTRLPSFSSPTILSLGKDKEKVNGNVVLRDSSQTSWDLFGYYIFLEGPVTVEKRRHTSQFWAPFEPYRKLHHEGWEQNNPRCFPWHSITWQLVESVFVH